MRRTTARILILASFFVQGVHAGRPQLTGNSERELEPISINFKDTLDALKPPSNEFLPVKPSEVTITKLRPLTLGEVERLAESNSPRLKAIGSQVEQAKFLLRSETSAWYPSINLLSNNLPSYLEGTQFRNPDYTTKTKFNSKTGSLVPEPYTNSRQLNFSVLLELKWDLIAPSRVPSIASARDYYEQAKYTYQILSREIRLQAASQYFALQLADEGVRIGQQSITAVEISLRDAKARFKAGVATKLDVLEAETQLARDKQLLTRRLGDQKITRRNLASILNLPQNITPTAASPSKVLGIWQPSLQESIVAAYKFREEFDEKIKDISRHNNNANVALASSQPTLSIVNTLSATRFQGQAGIASNEDIKMEDYGWTSDNVVGLTAVWNIFDGGRAKALYRYHKEKAEEGKINFAFTRSNIRREVEESFFNLYTANQDISTTTRGVLASRESLRLARLRFQAGVTTQREVVNNQRDLTQAEVRYAEAISSYNSSLAQLRRRTGLDDIKECPSAKKSDSDELNMINKDSAWYFACQSSSLSIK